MLKIAGIELATINCGLKYKNRDDLLLIKFDEGTTVAGVFTKSSTAAAPVNWCRKNIGSGKARGLIVNAGNANAFTGAGGDAALLRIVNKLSELLNCESGEIFMSSTGVIGERLKDELIIPNLPELVQYLSDHEDNWIKAARAIMTTDLTEKFCSAIAKINGKEVRINGFAKGSGMIAPDMATMLGYIFTDANISATALQEILSEINEETFNCITVDSDTSTNDTALIFATKKANHEEVNNASDPCLLDFKKALKEIMTDLAKKVVIDGEGATKLIEIKVSGAKSKRAAKNIALSIANSPLVKTAIAGADPNWGRIIMAIGKSGEQIEQTKISLKIGDFVIVESGEISSNYLEGTVHQYLKGDQIKIMVCLNLIPDDKKESESATVWTCDLTEGYIKINKDYRS